MRRGKRWPAQLPQRPPCGNRGHSPRRDNRKAAKLTRRDTIGINWARRATTRRAPSQNGDRRAPRTAPAPARGARSSIISGSPPSRPDFWPVQALPRQPGAQCRRPPEKSLLLLARARARDTADRQGPSCERTISVGIPSGSISSCPNKPSRPPHPARSCQDAPEVARKSRGPLSDGERLSTFDFGPRTGPNGHGPSSARLTWGSGSSFNPVTPASALSRLSGSAPQHVRHISFCSLPTPALRSASHLHGPPQARHKGSPPAANAPTMPRRRSAR